MSVVHVTLVLLEYHIHEVRLARLGLPGRKGMRLVTPHRSVAYFCDDDSIFTHTLCPVP